MAQEEGSSFRAKLDQAWTDWIQPLGLLIVIGLAYGAYTLGIASERVTGTLLVLAVVVGSLLAGIIPALPRARGTNRMLLWVLFVLAAVGAGWPTLHVALSTEPLASARLTTAEPKATLTTDREGPYELIVSGAFKNAGQNEVEASYALTVEGNGKQEVSGDIKRAMHHYRTSRKGGTSSSLEERTEIVHRIDGVSGHTITVSTEGIDDQLDGGLQVGIRSAGPRPEIFWALCAIAVLIGLYLDARLVVDIREDDRKVRGPKREVTYLTVVAVLVLVFSINFPMEATPHSLVKAGLGAALLALLIGFVGGWPLAAFARLASRPRRKT